MSKKKLLAISGRWLMLSAVLFLSYWTILLLYAQMDETKYAQPDETKYAVQTNKTEPEQLNETEIYEAGKQNIEHINYQVDQFYDSNVGKMAQESGLGFRNYKKSDGRFDKIDTSLIQNGDVWSNEKNVIKVQFPKYADGWFIYHNDYEDNDHFLNYRPVAEHVPGKLQEDGSVLYKSAFGKNMDLKVTLYPGGFRKEIIIREKPEETISELHFDFEVENTGKGVTALSNRNDILSNRKALTTTFAAKETSKTAGTFIAPMKAWWTDEASGTISIDIDCEFYRKDSKVFLRKIIGKDILDKCSFPLYTDSDTGAKTPGNAFVNTSFGEINWNNPTDITVDDDVGATAGVYSLKKSYYLCGTNYGFSIASDQEIDGIYCAIQKRSLDTEGYDARLRIIKSDGSIGTQDKANTTTRWPRDWGWSYYGSSNDLWGESWSYSDINDSDFGIAFSITAGAVVQSCAVDVYKITIYYTSVSTPTPISTPFRRVIIIE